MLKSESIHKDVVKIEGKKKVNLEKFQFKNWLFYFNNCIIKDDCRSLEILQDNLSKNYILPLNCYSKNCLFLINKGLNFIYEIKADKMINHILNSKDKVTSFLLNLDVFILFRR